MKILFKNLSFIFLLFIFMGCDKNEIEPEVGYKIEFGSECGWCAGQEFITITSSDIKYVRNIPCGEEKGVTNHSRKISSAEWDEITLSFDYSLFKTLEYNECNVCVDGCDEIIRITDIEDIHELRYSFSDEVEGMENLRQIFADLMEEMRKMN